MSIIQKMLSILLAMAVFVLVTLGFFRGLQDAFVQNRQDQQDVLIYTRPETIPVETT